MDCEVFEFFTAYRWRPADFLKVKNCCQECSSLIGIVERVVFDESKHERCANLDTIIPFWLTSPTNKLTAQGGMQQVHALGSDASNAIADSEKVIC